MDPLVLSRLASEWHPALAGASFAGIRARLGGLELVFDRAPDETRAGARMVLSVRFAPPVWAWLEPSEDGERGGSAGSAGGWVHRPPSGTQVFRVFAPTLDRRIAIECAEPGGEPIVVHVELWPPGNVIALGSHARIAWCARTRPPSTYRAAIAAGLTYEPPATAALADPRSVTAETIESWLGNTAIERWPLVLSRQMAGLPRGALEALLPTLPHAVLEGTKNWSGLSHVLAVWARETYGNPPVHGITWQEPSPGALLVSRALPIPKGTGPFDDWSSAATAVAARLPAAVDQDLLAGARARLKRLTRAAAAVARELEEAGQADLVRAQATALAAFLPRVAKGAEDVTLPDPARPGHTLAIPLDPKKKPHENVDRLFQRAGKLDRTKAQAPARLAEIQVQIARAEKALVAIENGESGDAGPTAVQPARPGGPADRPARLRSVRSRAGNGPAAALEPRRYRTKEGWEVWIGRNNRGNDHLTHRLARPEDYWMHVHGAAGSHVVLRRGKGPNEPSKATLEEVAAWAAFFSQARNAGTVPVTVTQKKYVRKPRKSPPGLAEVMRSKTVFARPLEPPEAARVEEAEA